MRKINNNIITEDYVSFETAKLLKEKGFDGECSRFYMPNGHSRWKYEYYHDFDISDRIECPTQMAIKWLREKHIFIVLDIISFDPNDLPIWTFDICFNSNHEYRSSDYFDSYEQACETAIKYCLKYLL